MIVLQHPVSPRVIRPERAMDTLWQPIHSAWGFGYRWWLDTVLFRIYGKSRQPPPQTTQETTRVTSTRT